MNTRDRIFEEYQDIITVKELQKMLKIGRTLAYELVRSGKIPSIKIGRGFRIQKEKVISYLQKEDKIDRKFTEKK